LSEGEDAEMLALRESDTRKYYLNLQRADKFFEHIALIYEA